MKKDTRTKLQIISTKLEEITRTDSDERIHIFTDQKELMELSAQINALLEKHQKIKVDYRRSLMASKKMLSNISHDIKTPLTSIINYVDLLKREKIQNEKIQRYLEILEQKSQRLKTLTEDLVEASKASSGNLKLEIANRNSSFWQKKEKKMKQYYFTSESVTEGHPDKLCDYISDSILDAYLQGDENSRVAVETFAANNSITIAGQVTSKTEVDIEKIVRNCIKEIGYDNENVDMDYRTCKINIDITRQSPDIAMGVDIGGAGDQGIMFGYACNETECFMPLPIYLAHKLAKRLTDVRKQGIIEYLRPDGKVQVTVEYEGKQPIRVDTVVVSTQHIEEIEQEKLKVDIMNEAIQRVIPSDLLDDNTKYFINPTGRFVIGGPLGDVGLTGRKIIVDTYGGYSRHGGGAFSGKDYTKVDRSASYMARFIAKNIVANGYAKRCEIQLAYAIGVAKPVSIYVDTFGTSTISEEEIIQKIQENFDLTPRGIINTLNLDKPIYRQTSNYGHFGEKDLPWEKLINF